LLTTATDMPGVSKCLIADSFNSTVALTSAPQYITDFYFGFLRGAKPVTWNNKNGLDYFRMSYADVDDWQYNRFSAKFPDQAAFTSCENLLPGPHFGGFISTYWSTVSTTSYVAGPAMVTATTTSGTTQTTTYWTTISTIISFLDSSSSLVVVTKTISSAVEDPRPTTDRVSPPATASSLPTTTVLPLTSRPPSSPSTAGAAANYPSSGGFLLLAAVLILSRF